MAEQFDSSDSARHARPLKYAQTFTSAGPMKLELGGTLSGEHGVGLEKRDYIGREIDPVTLDLMRRLKREFDPRGILNPDKMFPLPTADPSAGP